MWGHKANIRHGKDVSTSIKSF